MRKLCLPRIDVWDEQREEFVTIGGVELEFEHSLYTVAAWESKWKKPFANPKGLSPEEMLDYIKNFMCQTPDVPPAAWMTMTESMMREIQSYIDDKACATTVKHRPGGRPNREIVTAELIYFYMSQFGIPFECEHWHLNRLMTLIDVCSVKNAPPRKMGKREAAMERRALNSQRRAASGSRG